MFEQRFPEKRAFITGAASGLGLAFCENLASRGWRLFIADINTERLADAKASLEAMGGTVIAKELNVAREEDLEAAAADLEQAWGGVDMVFNNAGVAGAGVFEELTMAEWRRMIDIDLWSVIYGCRVFVPMLKAQGSGYIVNTASSAGTLAAPQMASYNVAKAGVVSLSETLKVELAPFNIGVTVVCPTVFKTNLGESLQAGTAFDNNLAQHLAISKVSPEDIVTWTFKKMARNKLYSIPQADGRRAWCFKRYFPEQFLRLMSYLYRNRKWAFSHLE
jgi:NAD(P)-dependent dehydrogenase (short-subunit alcohol dehydrogenase family)